MKTALLALVALVTTTASPIDTMHPTPDDALRATAYVGSLDPAPHTAVHTPTLRFATRPHPLPAFPGYEQEWHQANDRMIVRVVEDFNAAMGWGAGHPNRLDPALVKAWALQESGGHRTIFTGGDMMQMNNPGDWAPEKVWFGVERGARLTPEQSLRAALLWAYYKGEETRPMRSDAAEDGWYPTERNGETLEGYQSRFTNWRRALTRYNGGGVRDYYGDIQRRLRRLDRTA